MLVFGHVGITLGAVMLLNKALTKGGSLYERENKKKASLESSPKMPGTQNRLYSNRAPWFTSMANRIDIRLVLLGSLLPDIIDKPVGQFFLRDTISNGRIFCHTLFFLLLITLVGFYFYQNSRKMWLLTLSFATFMHLIEDEMWFGFKTLLWPIYGFAFGKMDLTHWTQDIFHALLTDPAVYIPEIVGLGILIWFGLGVVRSKKVGVLIRNGQAW